MTVEGFVYNFEERWNEAKNATVNAVAFSVDSIFMVNGKLS